MKSLKILIFFSVLISIPSNIESVGLEVKAATAKCKQHLDQYQQVDCGMKGSIHVDAGEGSSVYVSGVTCNMTVAQTANQYANCVAMAAKAGDVLTFTKEELKGFQIFNIGQVTSKHEIKDIKAPAVGSGVIVEFITAQGLPINFLLKHKKISRNEVAGLDTESPEAQAYKDQLVKEFSSFPNNEADATIFFRQKRGIENTWTELDTRLSNPAHYPYDPTFNMRVYPNGLVVVETGQGDKKNKQIFMVGDFNWQSIDKAIPNKNRIPIGNNQFATPAEV